jgi:carbon storage regulator CsrA
MLVLKRAKDQKIVITTPNGDRITVMNVEGIPQTRIGVEAPKEYVIHRFEVQEAIDRERDAAAQG